VVIALHACTTPEVKTDFHATKDFKKFNAYAFARLTDLSKMASLTIPLFVAVLNRSLRKNWQRRDFVKFVSIGIQTSWCITG
jgi:hypothetical protein